MQEYLREAPDLFDRIAIVLLCCLVCAAPATAEDSRLAGSIEAIVDGRRVQFPSVALDVSARVDDDLASVRVVQTFRSPLAMPVNARYVFPLPQDAAVQGMLLETPTERVRAEIQERRQARQTFETAKRSGKVAALVDQERPNVFTQRVANLIPGATVRVELDYVQTVPMRDGAFELAIPLVVGPRFVPPADAEADVTAGAVNARLDTDFTQPPYAGQFAAGGADRSPLDAGAFGALPASVGASRVRLAVDLNGALPLAHVRSSSHRLDLVPLDGGGLRATLARPGTDEVARPNRDFVLRYERADDQELAAGALADGGYFTLAIAPPGAWRGDAALPREMVFLLDCSGSMAGLPMAASRAFMHAALDRLRPRDTFRIIRFSDAATEFAAAPVQATAPNIARGKAYADALRGGGGTMMSSGILQALSAAQEPGRVRNVVFLTDGYIGNDYEILALVRRHIGAARLFALGVGSGVNRFLLTEVARIGRGFTRVLDSSRDAEAQARALAARLTTPLARDIEIDWGAAPVEATTPVGLPDLYAGDSLAVRGRYTAGGTHVVLLRATTATGPKTLPIELRLPAPKQTVGQAGPANPLRVIWAREQIRERMREFAVPEALRASGKSAARLQAEVTELGLDHALLTRWTSFVAVAEKVVNPSAPAADADVPLAAVAGVAASAYAGQKALTGGYAAPEPAAWLGLSLLGTLLFGLRRRLALRPTLATRRADC
ncbi:MAG: VIT domain-containing protein [Pseudomonadota bacterium]